MTRRSAKLLLTLGILGILVISGIVVFADPIQATVVEVQPVEPIDPIPGPGPDPLRASGAGTNVANGALRTPDHTHSGFGRISGRIGIATALVGKLTGYKIVIQEELNENARPPDAPKPFHQFRSFRADLTKGTPFFDMERIPLSVHPYRVTVVADGMNGSTAFARLTAETPVVEVSLVLTPGTVFSVRVVDQRLNPRMDMDVHLIPAGTSLAKRNRHDGRTNNYGTVVFEDVEKGNYMIYVGSVDAPSAPPVEAKVYGAGASISRGRPKIQSKLVTVPDGKHVTVEVYSKYGIPLPQANLKAWQLEVQRYHELKATTDDAGRFEFQHVSFGKYQLSVDCQNHGRRDVKFEVKKEPGPMKVTVKMPR